MANDRMTPAMVIAERIFQTAQDLKWCARERYTASDGDIIRGPNEMVSLYARPTADEASDVAAALEAVIEPLRQKRVRELVSSIQQDCIVLLATKF